MPATVYLPREQPFHERGHHQLMRIEKEVLQHIGYLFQTQKHHLSGMKSAVERVKLTKIKLDKIICKFKV